MGWGDREERASGDQKTKTKAKMKRKGRKGQKDSIRRDRDKRGVECAKRKANEKEEERKRSGLPEQ